MAEATSSKEMDTPASEQLRRYELKFDAQCRSATSELLKTAKFMSMDSDLRVFQRFDELRLFVLLRLQHRLMSMAAELEAQHRQQEARFARGQIDAVKDDVLNGLAASVSRVLKDYDEAFSAQARVETLRSPPPDFVQDLICHCATHYPILPGDLGAKGLRPFRADTLSSTVAREKSWVHQFIDKHEFLRRFFAIKTKRKQDSMYIYSESSIRRLERTFVHVAFCFLLLCPIIALSVIDNSAGKLVVVVGFLLVAAFLTSGILTGANNAGLAVLAGYGAILIFFLGVKVDVSS